MKASDITVSPSPRVLPLLRELHSRYKDGLINMTEYVFEAKRLGYTVISAGEFLNDGVKPYETKIIEAPNEPGVDRFEELGKLTEKFTVKVD